MTAGDRRRRLPSGPQRRLFDPPTPATAALMISLYPNGYEPEPPMWERVRSYADRRIRENHDPGDEDRG